jgi:hypothetical protein
VFVDVYFHIWRCYKVGKKNVCFQEMFIYCLCRVTDFWKTTIFEYVFYEQPSPNGIVNKYLDSLSVPPCLFVEYPGQIICLNRTLVDRKDSFNRSYFEELLDIYFHTCWCYKVAKKNSDIPKVSIGLPV